jgi:Tol biopolymer transport system component
MPAAGAGPDDADAQRVTDDALEDWFPHPSPNGKLLLFLSFPAGTTGHDDRAARVHIRTVPMPGDRIDAAVPRTVVEVTGGQGTINVNSWSPDSTRFAYVTYQVAAPR